MDTASSRINPNDLNAKLQLLSDAAASPVALDSSVGTQPNSRQTLTPPSSFTPPPITREDEETRSYQELIRLGGRPVCSLVDFQKAYRTPQQHARALIPWLDELDTKNLHSDDIKAFTTQLEQWIHFQEWQLETRGRPCTMHGSNSSEFQHFLEEKRQVFLAMGEERIADGLNFEASMRTQWQQRLDVRGRAGLRDQGMNRHKGARESMAATKRRLKAAGFNGRRPFRFHNDPNQQDERATWIEYLRFECWWQDRTTQIHEANKAEDPDLETGQSSVTGLKDSKTGRPRPRRTKTTNPRAELHSSFVEVRQSHDEANDPEIIPIAQAPQNSLQHKRNEENELQQRRLEWIIAQIASIEASTQAPVPNPTAKRNRGDDEDGSKDEDATQAGGSLRKKRTISGRKTRPQAPGSRSKDVNVVAKSPRKAAPEVQKQSRMMLGLICPVPEM